MIRESVAAFASESPEADTGARCDELRVRGRVTKVLRLGEGRPILFLHGWGMTPQAYLPCLTALAAHGASVVAPCLPGFGGSDSLGLRQQGVSGVTAHVVALLEALEIDGPLQVVGHSFGGGIGLRLAAANPGWVHHATLFSPVGGAGDGAVPLGRLIGAALQDARHRWVPSAVGGFLGSFRAHPSAVISSAIAAWQSDQITDVLRAEEASVPVRILFSHSDRMVRPGPIPAHARRSVTVDMVNGAHSWLLGDPDRFAQEAMFLHRRTALAA